MYSFGTRPISQKHVDISNYDRIFVVGDIHGCYKELLALWKILNEDLGIGPEKDLLVFLGDYVDRGPNVKGVVDILLHIKALLPDTIFLRGNHEEMFMVYINEGKFSSNRSYHNCGGIETIRSYGFPIAELSERYFTFNDLAPGHRDFYESLIDMVVTSHYIFVHGGIDPDKPLHKQSDIDIMWSRYFEGRPHDFEQTVVYGHTPCSEYPHLHLPHYINMDTGCVFGGYLSCLELRSMIVYQVEEGGDNTRIKKMGGV